MLQSRKLKQTMLWGEGQALVPATKKPGSQSLHISQFMFQSSKDVYLWGVIPKTGDWWTA